MRIHIQTIRYSHTLGAFDARSLDDLLVDKDVASFREHFFVVDDVPHLLCVVTSREARVSPAARAERRDRGPPDPGERTERPNLAADLDEPARRRFNRFREWRRDRARKEGIAPYLILTDRQVLELIERRPDSRTALSQIRGIGESKMEKYGAEILLLLRDRPPAPHIDPPPRESNAETEIVVPVAVDAASSDEPSPGAPTP